MLLFPFSGHGRHISMGLPIVQYSLIMGSLIPTLHVPWVATVHFWRQAEWGNWPLATCTPTAVLPSVKPMQIDAVSRHHVPLAGTVLRVWNVERMPPKSLGGEHNPHFPSANGFCSRIASWRSYCPLPFGTVPCTAFVRIPFVLNYYCPVNLIAE